MKRRLALLAYLVLIALMLVPALVRADDGGLSLRAAPEASGDMVALSDIFTDVPAEADVAVVRAPAPGATLSLEPEALQRLARRQGLTWDNVEGLRRVVVQRPSQAVSAEAVAALVADALAIQEYSTYIVNLANPQALHAPVDIALAPQVVSLALDPMTHAFTADVALAPELESVRVTGRAEQSVALPVLARAVARDAVIAAEDISFVDMPASRAPADAIFDADAIVGLSARRALRAGVALKSFDLERPAVIAKGDIVVVRFENGALSLTARARALDDVAEGDQARFVNLQSSRVIEAVATGPGEAWLVASGPVSVGVVGGRP